MAKKTAADLKAEGETLNEIITMARKRPLNFALLIAKEGVVLEAHPTKGADVMRRLAKANGGGAKGTQGVMNVVGKLIELTCEDDDFPSSLGKTAKRHLKDCGLAYKVTLILPSGARVEDEDGAEDDAEDGGAASPVVASTAPQDRTPEASNPESGTSLPPQTPVETDLAEKLRAMVPLVRDLAAKGAPAAEKLGKGLQAIAAELAKGDIDRAKALLLAVGKGIADARLALGGRDRDREGDGTGKVTDVPKSGTVDPGALRAQLKQEFSGLTGPLEQLKDKASKDLAGKADQLSRMFAGLVEGDDLKKAAAVLNLLKTTITSEFSKLAETTSGVMDVLGGLAKDVKNVVDDMVETVTGEHGLSEAQRKALTDLRQSNPKAYEAAKSALNAMDKDGEVDISPDARQAQIEAVEAARKKVVAQEAALKLAQDKLSAASGTVPVPGSKWAGAVAAADLATKAFRDFSAGLPDPKTMTEKQRQDAMIEGMRLDRLAKEARAAIEVAKKEDLDAADLAVTGAQSDLATSKGDLAEASTAQEAQDAKRGLLDALAFGPLSPGATPPLKDEDRASFIAAYAKDGKLADDALKLAVRSGDPSVIARNIGAMADKVQGGFADPDGKKLDLPAEDLRAMGMNALRMGALQGDGYFQGFDTYLKSGKQLAPDPHGGLEGPLSDDEAETKRLNKVSLGRTSALGAAVVGPDGKVDFGSDTAKDAMDHMMFHPGSLKTFTPHVNEKMAEVKGLFSNPATSAGAQTVIDDTKVAPRGSAGRGTSQKLIAATMGKDSGTVTDLDAKAAVLSAMMTPLSQGPVGSCFSTAPVRNVRESDPVKAMGEYAKIATTGIYETPGGKKYPANLTSPPGENPLMRSWEYSVATAAGNMVDGVLRDTLGDALMPTNSGSKGFRGLKAVVGDDAWYDTTDPTTGLKIPGVRKKLFSAITRKLKFEYDAGPPIGPGGGGGGGDGVSTDGGYKIKYNGAAVETEAAFMAAMREIALSATGERAGTDLGDQILAVVNAPGFKAHILSAYGGEGEAPWALEGGGYTADTTKVLFGGDPDKVKVFGKNSGIPKEPTSDRTVRVLKMMTGMAAPDAPGMKLLATNGPNANHAFNALPKDPGLASIADPDADQKIEDLLLKPGRDMAARKMPVEETARMFDDQIRAMADKASGADRDLLIAALKNKPTAEMTLAELNTKVATETDAFVAAVAQRKADAYIAEKEPGADNPRKLVILNFYKGLGRKDITADLVNAVPVPQVTVADTNWGDPTSQIYFVAAPDPMTGELTMWKKDKFTGRMTLAGAAWTDAKWQRVE